MRGRPPFFPFSRDAADFRGVVFPRRSIECTCEYIARASFLVSLLPQAGHVMSVSFGVIPSSVVKSFAGLRRCPFAVVDLEICTPFVFVFFLPFLPSAFSLDEEIFLFRPIPHLSFISPNAIKSKEDATSVEVCFPFGLEIHVCFVNHCRPRLFVVYIHNIPKN